MPGELTRVAAVGLCLLAMVLPTAGCSNGNSESPRTSSGTTSLGSEMELVHDHSGPIDLVFTPDGRYLVTWEPQPEQRGITKLYIWETRHWEPVGMLDLDENFNHEVDALPDNTILHGAMDRSGGNFHQYRIVPPPIPEDPVEPPSLKQTPVELRRRWSDCSPDGRYEAYRPVEDGIPSRTRIVVTDLETGKTAADIVPYRGLAKVQGFSPDSRYLIFSGTHAQRSTRAGSQSAEELPAEPPMRIWDLASNRESPRWTDAPQGAEKWRLLGFDSGGRQMVCLDDQSTVWVVDFQTGAPVSQYELPDEPGNVALAPDGTMLVYGTEDGQTTALDLPTQRSYNWDAYSDINSRYVFSPDSRYLVSSGSEQASMVLIWETAAIRRAMDHHQR